MIALLGFFHALTRHRCRGRFTRIQKMVRGTYSVPASPASSNVHFPVDPWAARMEGAARDAHAVDLSRLQGGKWWYEKSKSDPAKEQRTWSRRAAPTTEACPLRQLFDRLYVCTYFAAVPTFAPATVQAIGSIAGLEAAASTGGANTVYWVPVLGKALRAVHACMRICMRCCSDGVDKNGPQRPRDDASGRNVGV